MKRPVIISLCALLMAAVMFFAVIPANADGGGSGQVTLCSALDGFNGRFTYKGGITHVS